MSEGLDLVGHGISAGGGAVFTLVADRVIRFFTDRDRHKDEIALAARLASIETKLDQLNAFSRERESVSSQIARLDERLKALEPKK